MRKNDVSRKTGTHEKLQVRNADETDKVVRSLH